MFLGAHKARILRVLSAIALAIVGYSHLSHSAAPRPPLYEKISRTKKLQNPATVKIHMVEENDVEAGQVYTLEAVIKTPKAYANAEWEWSAPAGVTLLDRTSGSGLQVKPNEELKISMRFRQGDTENRRVRFVLKDVGTGAILGRSGYGTTRQRAIAQENKELLERQEIFLEENSNEVFKVKEPKHSH